MSYQDIDIERLSAEVNINTEKLKRFAEKYAESATAEANKRIDALDGEVAESDFVIKQTTTLLAEICLILKGEPPAKTLYGYHDLPKMVRELQANNHDLREVLKTIAIESHEELWQREFAFKALSTTPAESLQAHDDEVIENCAKVCRDMVELRGVNHDHAYMADKCAAAISALKEVK